MTSKYPIYILSKGRAFNCLTAKCFIEDKVDFYLVVEPQEYDEYRKSFPKANILILPKESAGHGAIPVRNWIWQHSKKNGFERHWEFDDNIRLFRRLNKGKRIRCNAQIGINVIEEFTDRYTNIAISGFNYTFFVMNEMQHPYFLNCHVYSAMLIDNNIPYRWRLRFNADTDLCLQVITNNLCTVLFNAFTCDKQATMTMKGGNTNRYKGDGRLIMSKTLEEVWPEYVKTKIRFGRPQHYIVNDWKDFKHPLKRRTDIDWNEIENKKYKIQLTKQNEIKSNRLKKFYEDNK
jgi:hypothetical protein|tara:strand:- start:338 stop:1210 length:873 start_codon:yes stop_codon:yes gene_type:complete